MQAGSFQADERARRFLAGRLPAGLSSAALPPAGLLATARAQHLALLAQPRAANLTGAWTPAGPTTVQTPAFGKVTGRVTSIAVDPADPSGNTVYLGTTGGGVWKSTNAINASGAAAAITFNPLTDTLPVFAAGTGSSVISSLSIGAVSVAQGVVLAGTGDPNDATDSYYGEGVLRSADGGQTWTLIQSVDAGAQGSYSLTGLAFAGFAWASTRPGLVVAAVTSSAEGVAVNAPAAGYSRPGLVVSSDGGQSWQVANLYNGGDVTNPASLYAPLTYSPAATSVVWNPVRQRFYAALRRHGYYESVDGRNWVRLAAQPGVSLNLAHCPATPAGTSCPVYRGVLAVQPVTGDTFALTVDATNQNQGLWQDTCLLSGSACQNAEVQFSNLLNTTPLEAGTSAHRIPQGTYNLTLAASASGADTTVYVGTEDLYRCTLATGCALRNATNATNGCAYPAGVASAQHALALTASGTLLLGNDAGLWRSVDGVAETGGPCSPGDAGHFENLNAGLGSLAEIVSFAEDPSAPGTLLAGLGALGTAGTDGTGTWAQLASGEGGNVQIDPANPAAWYLSPGAGAQISRCLKGVACTPADFTPVVTGATDLAGDDALVTAPWRLDGSAILLGTCRMWRGPAPGSWSAAHLLSAPFFAPAAAACGANAPVVRSVAAGGPSAGSGATVLYAGMAGALDGGSTLGGHLFTTIHADVANASTVWTDRALAPVSNDPSNGGLFNPAGFDLSAVVVDAHDSTGLTVYTTVQGFSGNGLSVPHVYRSTDGGQHWLSINANLPNAPVNDLLVDPNDANTVYVAMDTGVYVTTSVTGCNSGQCWSVLGRGLPNAPALSLQASAALLTADGRRGLLRVGTYGRGIWSLPLLTALAPAAPAITLSQVSIAFSSQQTGTQSSPVSITVTNSGTATLTVTNIAVTGDFLQQDNCTASAIGIGSTCSIDITFAPQQAGLQAGVLTIYGNVPGGQATVQLSGTATAPASVVLTPLASDFGTILVGSTSASQSVTISNTGGEPASLSPAVVTGDFAITANTCSSSLAAETGCTVSLSFTPHAAGRRTGSLTVTGSAGTQVAGLSGIGQTAATDQLSTSALAFPPQVLGSTSAVQPIALLNSGTESLTQIGASVTGPFNVVNGCGPTLIGNAACSFSVAFLPRLPGPAAGTLTISDLSRSQTVSLTAIGLAPPGVSLSPVGGLGFSPTGVGLASASETVTLTNNGGSPLALTGVSVTGDFLLAANTCGAALAPSGVCQVTVVFQPQSAGARTGTLAFLDSAAGGTQSTPLTGTGVDFTLAADGPATATIKTGQSASYLLLLGSGAGTPGTAVFTCAGAPLQASCQVTPVTTTLGGVNGTVVTVTVATGLAGASLSPEAAPWLPRGVVLAPGLPLLLLGFRRKRGHRLVCRLGFLVVIALSLDACSTGRTIPGATTTQTVASSTPPGTYTLLVAGSSAGLVRSVQLTLIVQ